MLSVAGSGRWRALVRAGMPTRQGRCASLRTGLRPVLDPRDPAALGQGVAGRAMALPASSARRLMSRGSFRISAESLRGEQVADLLDGFAVAEAFSGPVVEFGGDPVQISLAVHGQVAALREVLAQ